MHDSGADSAPGDPVIASCTAIGTPLVLHLADEIDRYGVILLRSLRDSATGDGSTGSVLETAQVVFCDSGFLPVRDRWPRQGRGLRSVGRSRPVRRRLNAAASARQQSSRMCTPSQDGTRTSRPSGS